MTIATKSKRRWREGSFGRWTQKNLWNSVHYEQSYKRSCWLTLNRQYAFGVCQCIWVRGTWLWCQGNFTTPLISPQSDLGRRADSRLALPQISSFFYFVYFVVILYFPLLLWNWTVNQEQIGGKDDPYLEGIETKFQWDLLRGFGGKAFCYICSRWLGESVTVDCPKYLIVIMGWLQAFIFAWSFQHCFIILKFICGCAMLSLTQVPVEQYAEPMNVVNVLSVVRDLASSDRSVLQLPFYFGSGL